MSYPTTAIPPLKNTHQKHNLIVSCSASSTANRGIIISMKTSKGFTVIELLIVATFLITATVVLFIQYRNLTNQLDNDNRRTAINAIYFSLEEGFYKNNSYYPEIIGDETLPTMDAELLIDPNGVKIGESDSVYRYEPANCQDGKCQEYTLRTSLTNEEDFIRQNRNGQTD